MQTIFFYSPNGAGELVRKFVISLQVPSGATKQSAWMLATRSCSCTEGPAPGQGGCRERLPPTDTVCSHPLELTSSDFTLHISVSKV